MSNEEKIAAAIDRNTEAVNKVRWNVAELGIWLWLLWTGICVVGCPHAKATPLLPSLEETAFVDIGEPPAPPPNPHIQYWYTMDVPGPDGVLPQEVFAPRLVAAVATCVDCTILDNRIWNFKDDLVETPEPGTRWLVATYFAGLVGGWFLWPWLRKVIERRKARKALEEK